MNWRTAVRTAVPILFVALCALIVIVGTHVKPQMTTRPAEAAPVLRTTYSYAVVVLPAKSNVSVTQRELTAYGKQGYRQVYVIEPDAGVWGYRNGCVILERVH